MTKESKITNESQLLDRCKKMIAEFGGALVEEFIEGREFTVLVAENPSDKNKPITFIPLECKFKEGESFKHFDLKWVNYNDINWVVVKDQEL